MGCVFKTVNMWGLMYIANQAKSERDFKLANISKLYIYSSVCSFISISKAFALSNRITQGCHLVSKQFEHLSLPLAYVSGSIGIAIK